MSKESDSQRSAAGISCPHRRQSARERCGIVIAASMIVVNIAFASNAASLEGVNLPDTPRVNGTEVYLNGIALRTFPLMGIRIYVAGLYLEHLRDNAEQILASPEKKLLEFRFLHDVDVNNARKAWRE